MCSYPNSLKRTFHYKDITEYLKRVVQFFLLRWIEGKLGEKCRFKRTSSPCRNWTALTMTEAETHRL